MPRNTSDIYSIPPDTEGFPDTTIESAKYNTFIHDVETDLNTPRPVVAGGTGANDADEALINLSGEKADQLVDNYDSYVWMPGSFRSAGTATNAPVAGHAFAGIVYINEPLADPPTNANVIVSARDMDDTVVPSRVYVREKKANVWGPWTVIDASTLPFTPGGGLSATTILAAIQELDTEKAAITYVDAADATKASITYVDAADATKVSKSGGANGVMTGFLTLNADPTALLHAATKQYVDGAIAAAFAGTFPTTELQFVRASSQYMTRTFGTTSSLPWTLSMWVRRASLGTHQAVFGVEVSTNKVHIGFGVDNKLWMFFGTDGLQQAGSTAVAFTNVGTWYNIIWTSSDAVAAPAAKSMNINVNNGVGTIIGGFQDPGFNTAIAHYIGQPVGYPDLAMKEVIFVDGSALPPSAFGVSASGIWSPKLYTGSYGPNGFRLTFNNQLSVANLGKDSSPNGNHWTAFNF